jgi:hypothetical protein
MSRIACCNICADSNGSDMVACDCCSGDIKPEDALDGKRVPTLYGPDRKPIRNLRNYRNFSSHPCQNGGSCKCGGTCKGDGYSNWAGIPKGIFNTMTKPANTGSKLQACQAEAQAKGMVLGVPTTVSWVQDCLNKKRGGNINNVVLPGGWNLWGKRPLSGSGSNLNKKLEQCKTDAQALGMVLGQPNTVTWVTNCLNGKTNETAIVTPTPTTPTTTTTITTTPKTAGIMGLPNIAWVAIAGVAIYYGNKKGMFKKILK